MALRFNGIFDQKVDEKGRVNVPQKFRDLLKAAQDERIYVTASIIEKMPCLDAYPSAEWESLLQRLEARTDLPADISRYYYNCYLPAVQECEIDRQGRILLPTRLRDHARLVKDVVFTGVNNLFRIWSADTHRSVFDASQQVLLNNPQIVPGVGI
jgi:transcriptional regulator MraZ